MITDNQGGDKMSHDKYSSIVYQRKTLKEWSIINKVPLNTIRARMKKGYSLEIAIKPKKLCYKP